MDFACPPGRERGSIARLACTAALASPRAVHLTAETIAEIHRINEDAVGFADELAAVSRHAKEL
jgi:hypothetical protein